MARRVAGGATVQFRPSGTSMAPLIRSRQLVAVAPVDAAKLETGDIVLARVAGTTYLHLVSAVDRARGRVQISNNRGRVNGWTAAGRVFGICVAVDGQERTSAKDKVRTSGRARPDAETGPVTDPRDGSAGPFSRASSRPGCR